MEELNTYLFEYDGQKLSAKDLTNTLKEVGIGLGDKLFIHSDLRSFGKVNPQISKEEYLGAFVEVLINLVGKEGTIIMPTFSYSFCKGEIYNPKETLSTVGSLTEYFRQLPDVMRTIDPIFSVATWGDNKESYMNVGFNCFGDKSIFKKIHDEDFKILFLGETFDMTYLHFIEQSFGVPYRYIKKFTGKIKIDNKLKEYTFDYYVRDLEQNSTYDLERIADFLESKGVLKKASLGFSQIKVVGTRDVREKIIEELKENNKFLLKNNV
jgi:aminoglycoside 3-N-acetyltransferase